jgi:hypothetical protein
MHTTKIRTTLIALVASVGFAGAAIAPAVSQAQWHTLNVGGQIITHGATSLRVASARALASADSSAPRKTSSATTRTGRRSKAQANGWRAKKSKPLKPRF